MAGNWLSSPPGWSVSQASGNAGGSGPRRFVLTAPNRRRWETVAVGGHELREIAKELAVAGRCLREEPLDAVLPDGVIPPHVREIPQRRCRDCSQARKLERFAGAARTCKTCTLKLCGGPKRAIVPCPVCAEPRAGASIVPVPGLGLACPSCAVEATRAAERAAAEVVVLAARPAPSEPRASSSSASTEGYDEWFAAMDGLAAAFGAPAVAAAPKPPAPPPPAAVAPVEPAPALRLPQIRDFDRLRLLLQLVASGVVGSRALGEAMGSKPSAAARHACFYREAAELLGLLEPRRWSLTPLGERFLAAEGDDQRQVLREAVAGAASLGPLAQAVLSEDVPELAAVIEAMGDRMPALARATLERRVRDVLSWRAALGLAPLRRAQPRRAPARVARPAQLRLWEPSANGAPLHRPRVTALVHQPLAGNF